PESELARWTLPPASAVTPCHRSIPGRAVRLLRTPALCGSDGVFAMERTPGVRAADLPHPGGRAAPENGVGGVFSTTRRPVPSGTTPAPHRPARTPARRTSRPGRPVGLYQAGPAWLAAPGTLNGRSPGRA